MKASGQPAGTTPRAVLYLRVSTARQAEHDVSIPDQRRQGEAYCASRGFELVETFVEAGASAMNDRRPEFQRMIEEGTSKPSPFDIVVVHSFSRFFRDHFELEFYIRKLAKNGVKLVSITQEMGDDPNRSITPEMVETLAEAARQRIRIPNGGYRRDHLRALAQRIEVADKEVRIMGSRAGLLQTLAAASSVGAAKIGVPSSVLKWRTRRDSNSRPLPSEGSALSS